MEWSGIIVFFTIHIGICVDEQFLGAKIDTMHIKIYMNNLHDQTIRGLIKTIIDEQEEFAPLYFKISTYYQYKTVYWQAVKFSK